MNASANNKTLLLGSDLQKQIQKSPGFSFSTYRFYHLLWSGYTPVRFCPVRI